MKILNQISALQNYKLQCEFSDGETKIADITPYFSSEIFKKIENPLIFKNAENHGYFVSWLNETVDLSADTLWHIGKTVTENPQQEIVQN